MHNNKVYTILQHFKKNDFKQFSKYINSPYFNKSKLLIQYYNLLEKQLHSSNPNDFPKEKFWKKLFSPQKYNDVRFRKLSSDLLKLIEGYLSQEIYQESPMLQKSNLLKSLGLRGLEKYYSHSLKEAIKISDNFPYRDSDFYFKQYMIQKTYFEIGQIELKSEKLNLDEIDENLNIFYFTEKLRYLCTALSIRQKSFSYNINYAEKIIEITNSIKNPPPSLAIYQQIYLTLTEKDSDSSYFKLKNLLKIHGSSFKHIEARSLYDSAINYGIQKLNTGNTDFLNEVFELYQDFLIKGSIFIKDELHPFHFKNIITIALRLNKFDWTENFIWKNKERLPENSKENAVTFNLARLHYYRKDYDKAITLLQQVEYEDVVYGLSSKSLLIAVYYENNEIEPLYSLLESFRAYLNRRQDIPKEWKRSRLNLIKFTKKLIKIIPGDNGAIVKLKNEISQANSVADINWLKEKIAELE